MCNRKVLKVYQKFPTLFYPGVNVSPLLPYESCEEIEKFYYHHNDFISGGTTYLMINQTANLMYMMSQDGQIDSSYAKDLGKLQRHAFLVSVMCACLYNLAVVTGSTTLRSTGDIRELCNGLLDRFENELNIAFKNRREELMRNYGIN